MRAVIVYESMYGNTRAVADAIGTGLAAAADVTVLPIAEADEAALHQVDLLVLGGPTHTFGMSRPSTRLAAAQAAEKPASGLHAEPGAQGPGLREWLEEMPCIPSRVAVFDTRVQVPMGLSGSAARRISRVLRRDGFESVAAPESFYVTKQNQLVEGELTRATAWGATLATTWSRLFV
jgi:hypothetical protein